MTSHPDVIWLRPERSTSGKPAGLSRAEITRAAVGIADRLGLEAITMRQVAAELDTGAATLYRHLRTRDDLVDLMGDHVASLYRLSEPTGDGVADLITFCEEVYRVMRQHPWMTALTRQGNRLGPHQIAAVEHVLRILEGTPGSHADHLEMFSTVVAVTAMWVQNERTYHGDTALYAWMTHIIASGRFPLLTLALVETRNRYASNRLDEFRRVLRLVITGLLADGPESRPPASS